MVSGWCVLFDQYNKVSDKMNTSTELEKREQQANRNKQMLLDAMDGMPVSKVAAKNMVSNERVRRLTRLQLQHSAPEVYKLRLSSPINSQFFQENRASILREMGCLEHSAAIPYPLRDKLRNLNGVKTLYDLQKYTEIEILIADSVGLLTLEMIKEALTLEGLTLLTKESKTPCNDKMRPLTRLGIYNLEDLAGQDENEIKCSWLFGNKSFIKMKKLLIKNDLPIMVK
jgi:hypothetical protein